MIALFITICFTVHTPAVCHEGAIVPGGGLAAFKTEEACRDGQAAALQYWFDNAGGPVLGITGMSGGDYEIKNMHCGPLPADDDDEH